MVDGWRVARQQGDTARRSAYPEVTWASRAVATCTSARCKRTLAPVAEGLLFSRPSVRQTPPGMSSGTLTQAPLHPYAGVRVAVVVVDVGVAGAAIQRHGLGER